MAGRSKCTNRRVGAVVVDASNRPVAVGYNGPPADMQYEELTGTCSDFCDRSGSTSRGISYANCVAVHAEANALLFADRTAYRGGTIYITNPCCWECTKLIANSGLRRVVFEVSNVDAHAEWRTHVEFLIECSIEVSIVEGE